VLSDTETETGSTVPVSTKGPGAVAPVGGGVAPAAAAPAEQRSAAAQSAGQLANTGFELPILLLGGLSALAAGALLRRRAGIGA
jgi:LPXTG-motif cell wall-anchored protein